MKDTKKLTSGIGDLNGHVGKKANGFEGVHEGNGIGEQNLEFCDQKNFCVANTWFKKKGSGSNKTEVDFVLVEKKGESS